MSTSKQQWWQGRRGEWYVALQGVIFALLVLGPKNGFGLSPWPDRVATLAAYGGGVLIALGATMSVVAALHLGDNLTPLPHPKENASLVVSGAYRLVRHPIYCGIVLIAFGWALFVNGSLTLVYAALLLLFFDIKSRREEAWLSERFPDYADYQKRVRKLIPFIY
jgi:protein-S-isoprenylcysteine O-methyltransferase Ste14